VTPGRIDTPIIRDVPPEVNAEFAKRTPLGRLGTAEDIAGAILFFTSASASFITGATLDVNGGLLTY
jgi:3-oxoacyl-[acyl-carrier protein] reductase